MPSLTIGLETPENLFNTDVCDRVELRSIMAVHRNVCYDLSGEGLGSFLKSIFSRGVKLYNKAKPYVDKGLKYYDTATDLAQKAQKVYQSDEFNAIKNKLPPSVLKKEQQLINKAKPYVQKAQRFEKEAKGKYNQAIATGQDYWKKAEDIANKVDTTFGLEDKKAEKMPGDGLRTKLLKLEGKGCCRGRGAMLAGSGAILPGAGAILPGAGAKLAGEGWGDIIKLGVKMIPTIIDGIQRGSGLNAKAKKQLTDLTEQRVRQILPGVMSPIISGRGLKGKGIGDFLAKLAETVVTPVNLISNIMKRSQGGSGRGNAKIKAFQKDIEKTLAKCYLAKQQGRGVSTSDVLSAIGDTAEAMLPYLGFL
jgi:hypothetical protein